MEIRRARDEEFDQLWPIIQEAFAAGETWPQSPEMTRDEGFQFWMRVATATYAAWENDKAIGVYYIKPNQPALGAHYCNAGYIVHSTFRGQGFGRALCMHSLEEARRLGFKAMQFNLVVSTNIAATRLWKSCGFHIVGILPKAFNHREFGLVDALVMYQWLEKREE